MKYLVFLALVLFVSHSICKVDHEANRLILSEIIRISDNINVYEDDPDKAREVMIAIENQGKSVVKNNDKGTNCITFLFYSEKIDPVCVFYFRQDIQSTSDIGDHCGAIDSLKNEIKQKKLC